MEDRSLHPRLDTPRVLAVLFHPRPEPAGWRPPAGSVDLDIPVEDGISLGARIHLAGKGAPNLLFFHGNGEIVADYDEIGQAYRRAGINFLAVDYRGYGRSGGRPTAAALLADSRRVLSWVQRWLVDQGHSGPLAVMGRSLGSAAALELAGSRPEALDALAIESGFARTAPLLATLGVQDAEDEIGDGKGFGQRVKIAKFAGPTLIIHAQNDHLIPLGEGQTLYDHSPAAVKKMLTIPAADHNDIFMRAWPAYLAAVEALLSSCRSG